MGKHSQEEMDRANVIFKGQVIRTKPVMLSKSKNIYSTTFRVLKTEKGWHKRKRTVQHTTNSAACGITFEVGKTYYVLAGRNKGFAMGTGNNISRKLYTDGLNTRLAK